MINSYETIVMSCPISDQFNKSFKEIKQSLDSITKAVVTLETKIKEDQIHNAYSQFMLLLSNKLKFHKKDMYCTMLLKDVVYNYTNHQYENIILDYDNVISKVLKQILSDMLIKYEYDEEHNKTKIYVWTNN